MPKIDWELIRKFSDLNQMINYVKVEFFHTLQNGTFLVIYLFYYVVLYTFVMIFYTDQHHLFIYMFSPILLIKTLRIPNMQFYGKKSHLHKLPQRG